MPNPPGSCFPLAPPGGSFAWVATGLSERTPRSDKGLAYTLCSDTDRYMPNFVFVVGMNHGMHGLRWPLVVQAEVLYRYTDSPYRACWCMMLTVVTKPSTWK